MPDITTGAPPLSSVGTSETGTLTAPRSIISALMMSAFCSDTELPRMESMPVGRPRSVAMS